MYVVKEYNKDTCKYIGDTWFHEEKDALKLYNSINANIPAVHAFITYIGLDEHGWVFDELEEGSEKLYRECDRAK